MFQAQPQIGSDMARERQELAARIRLVAPARKRDSGHTRVASRTGGVERKVRPVVTGIRRRLSLRHGQGGMS